MSIQGVKDSKDREIAEHVKAQLQEKIETTQDPLADTILEAGKAKLQKKPHDKHTELTSKFLLHGCLPSPHAAQTDSMKAYSAVKQIILPTCAL